MDREIVTTVFDTETTGKRPRGRSIPLDMEPALVQLAAVQYIGRRPAAHMSFFTQPLKHDLGKAAIPTDKFFIENGITQDVVDAVGVEYNVAMAIFHNMMKATDRVVAHNIAFDDPIIMAAFSRCNVPDELYSSKPKFCTMKTLEPVLKLPGKYGFKFPSLDESYRMTVNDSGFSGAHDAMVDVEACASVLWAIEDSGHDLWEMK